MLLRLGIFLFFFLVGVAFIVWGSRLSAFMGVLGLIEEFLPQALRSVVRQVVNTFVGLLFILIGLLIFLNWNRFSPPPPGSAPPTGATSGSQNERQMIH